MAFSPASVYDIKVITRTTSDLVLFTDTELRVVFSAKVTDTIQVSSDGGYIIVFTDSGEFKINVKPLDTVITPSATVSFTPSSPLLNVGASNYARLIDNRFSYLASNVFQGCCGKAPTYVGSLVVAYPDLAALTASSPGTTGVIYTTEDTNLLYWWDSGTSTFNLLSGVQYYANFAAFPLVGEERVLYYDIAAEEMYVWVSSAYVSLCCDATQVISTANQLAHGFSVGEVIYLSGDNTFALAQADNIATSYVAGIVIDVIDVDNFRYCTHGTINVGVPAQTGGTVMYLSETTPGALTATAPTSPDIVRPVMVVVDSGNQAIVMLSLVDSSGGSGTVTSVDLVMPSAFTVSGNPITTSGTLTVAGAGLTSQYVRGDGSLANFPTSTGGGASVSYYLNGSINQGTFGGVTYYEMNSVPILGPGTNFSIAANDYIASFITDANDPSQLNIPGGNWNFEMFFSASSGGGSPSFYVELYKYDGVAFTLIASSSASPELITGGTSIDTYITALAVPSTTLALTDRLAVRVYVNNSGRTITLHTEDNNLCQVITTFTTGITALNGQTEQVQTFATGTTGTDFGIVSATGTHTFNLPVASATNTGKLSSTDWSSFNGRIPLAGTSVGSPVTGDIEVNNNVKLIRNGGIGITSRVLLNNTLVNLQYTDGTITANVNAGDTYSEVNYSDATGAAYVKVYPQYVELGSGVNFMGAVYDSDHSANYTLRSLVDSGYVKGYVWHANAAPTVNDDSGDEFEVGTFWIDYSQSPPDLYVCTDDTIGAAVWTQVGVGGSGTVTSVGLSAPAEFTVTNSPVTGSGTLTLTKANQNANLVYAGPTTGAAAAPTFRSLVLADIPSGVAKETWANGQGATTVAAGATEYGSLYGGSVGDSTTESARQSVVPLAGTISRWYFRTSSGQPASGALTLRTRINGVNGNLLITIAAGSASGTFSDLVNSDTVAAGDLVNYSIANAAAGASAQQLTTSNLFTFS